MRETIREHSEKWEQQLKDAHARLDCAVGDAIVVAACATYFGQFVTEQKDHALKHWIQAAKFVSCVCFSSVFCIIHHRFISYLSREISATHSLPMREQRPLTKLFFDIYALLDNPSKPFYNANVGV